MKYQLEVMMRIMYTKSIAIQVERMTHVKKPKRLSAPRV